MFKLIILRGTQITACISTLAQLRIALFREYPYLYDGNIKYESQYLKEYANEPNAMLHVVYYGDEIAGMFSGMPLTSHSGIVIELSQAMQNRGLDNIDKYYYYGEVLISPRFRKIGIFNLLFLSLNYEAKNMGFTDSCLLTVERSAEHPQKPIGYNQSDGMWKRQGYKRNGIIIDFEWPTIHLEGNTYTIKNPMAAWETSIIQAARPNYDLLLAEICQRFSVVD